MASFTDQISQFNPYIQELPVEAMAQVGMAKQAQYDQGVKKVQNYIDRVAGLEIAKGPHKQYLQSKMDELGSRLKTVAAGDFSNQQLVNSVSGMTGQIIKDPIIQNAVYSTQVLKKGNADREAAAKAGKTSPNNDQDWEDQKVQWLNDGDLNTPFTGKFIEHWDVDKKLSDKAEQIMKYPDEFVADNPWKRDDAGNVLYFGTEVVKGPDGKAVIDPKTKQPVTRQIESTDPSKGQKQIDDAMLKISAKGTSAEKLYNNFLDSLDSRDAQQLRIDAKAAYRNVKPEAFARDAINVYEGRKKLQNQQMVNIAVALKEPNLTDVQKATLTARLNDLQASEKEGLLDKELNSVLEAIKNPAVLDKYKENLYTQKRLMNMATDMAYKSYKQELSTNPYAQMYMQKQNFNLEVKKFADDSRRGWANIDIARANQNLAERKFLYEMSKDAKEEAAKNPKPVITTTTLSTDIVPRTVDDEKKEVENLDNEIVSLKEEYGDTLFPNLVGIDNKWIALDNLINRYDTNPKAEYSPDELKFLQKYKDLNDKYLTKGKLVQNAEKFKETTRTALIKSKVDAGNSGFDNTEIADIAEQIKKFEKKDKFTVGTVMDKEAAKQFFTTYKGGKYLDAANSYMAEIRGINWFNNKGLNSQQLATARAIDKAAGTLSNIDEEVSTKTSEFLGKYSPKNLAQDAALDMNNEKTKAAVNKYLTSVALTDKSIGAGDASTVLKWQTGEDGGKMKVAIRKLSDGTTQAIFVKPDGSNTITLPMSTNQREFFPEIKETNPYASWIDATKASVKGTTDVMDNRTPEVTDAFAVTARKTGFDVPGFANNTKLAPLVRFTLEANQSNIGDDNDTYSLIMYAKGAKDTTWKGRRISDGYVPFGGIQNILNAVDDRAYYEIIKSKK